MTAEFDPELVEQAARALPWDRTAGGWQQNLDAARAVLDAVAPALRAEGETEAIRRGTLDWERGYKAGYQRGMVEGGKRVVAAVERARSDFKYATGARADDFAMRVYESAICRAREALARIEGGA